ncbi:hypothetical protein Tco_1003790 [Tanacetum coccineum]|uniref:Aminotransferase-like plant mobile domain-containing protein n=1 Tax=Tanacetum coccineum TaxID=301880 RepID=A0ABQ5FAK5_9ASTR
MLCKPKSFYNEKNKVTIGYKNPLCLTRARQVQSALYNGNEIVMTNHAPAVVHDSEDTLEIVEITRKRMLEKMKSPQCVENKVRDLTPEQLFWSNDKNHKKKAVTSVPKPLSALTVYPPNTPVTLVPRVLPIKSQVKINLYQCAEIVKKNLLIENENLIANCLTNQLLYDVEKSCCLDLEAEMSKVQNKSKHISKLKRENLNLQLKYQHLQESFDNNKSQASKEAPDFNSFFKIKSLEHQIKEKDNVIRDLKVLVSKMNARNYEPYNAKDVTDLFEQNKHLRADNNKVKQQYKEMFETIKVTRASTNDKTSSLLTQIEDVEPIPPRLKNNRSAHLDYINHLKESVEIVREIVEEARVVKPLDTAFNYACKYTKLSQELVEYVIGTCPKEFKERDNKAAAVIPLIRRKQVTVNSTCRMSINDTHKKVEDHPRTINKWLNSSNHKMLVPMPGTPTINIVFNKGKQIWKPKDKLSDNRKKFALGDMCPLIRLFMTCRTGHPLVSRLGLFKTYNGVTSKDQELCGKVHRDGQIWETKWQPGLLSKRGLHYIHTFWEGGGMGIQVNFPSQTTTIALSIENGSVFEGESKFKIYFITQVYKRSDWEDLPWLFRSVTDDGRVNRMIRSAPTRTDEYILPYSLAFSASASVPAIYIQQFWNTMKYDENTRDYCCQVDEQWFNLSADLLRKALDITPVDSAHPFELPLTGDTVIDFVNQLGYPEPVEYVSNIRVNYVYQPWRAILTLINQCLIGKTSVNDKPRHPVLKMLWGIVTHMNVDHADLLWEEFTQGIQTFFSHKASHNASLKDPKKKAAPLLIPYGRFTKIIIYYLGSTSDVHRRHESPCHLPRDDFLLEDEPQREGNDSDLELAKKLSLESHHEKGEGEDVDVDLEQAIKLSMNPSFLPQGHTPVGGVTIRERIAEKIPKLLESVGKGKAKVTEEQVAHSLIDLSKKICTTDQFILQRRDQASHDLTTGPSSQPQDDTSEKAVYESSLSTNSECIESGTETTASKVDEEKGKVASTSVKSGVGISIQTEGQAGSDPGKAHKALAGPDLEPMQEGQTGSDSEKDHVTLVGSNTEHMDKDFYATTYPKVHENLKLRTNEHVIEENPESHSGSMSSMKNLEDTDNFGDQFLNDKPAEDDQEKFNVVDKTADLSDQTDTSAPPVTTPVIGIPSSQITTPPINTDATAIITTLPEITPHIALQLRVAKLEQDMSEVKKVDHSATVLASIQSQVPKVVDKYLGTKIDDALLKALEKHIADLIQKYSVLPGPESSKK